MLDGKVSFYFQSFKFLSEIRYEDRIPVGIIDLYVNLCLLLVTSSSNKSTVETPTRSMTQTPLNEKRRNYRFYAGDPYEERLIHYKEISFFFIN